MEFFRKHFWTTTLLTVATVPLIGLMIYANLARTRSAAELAVADRCMDWAHESHQIQQTDDPGLSARCNLYFRVRSDENADEDIRRWETRAASAAKNYTHTASSPSGQ
jgi:hypothetical protein